MRYILPSRSRSWDVNLISLPPTLPLHPSCQTNEVEQLIWKAVHYRPIEEFRSRLKIAGQAVHAAVQEQAAGASVEEVKGQQVGISVTEF